MVSETPWKQWKHSLKTWVGRSPAVSMKVSPKARKNKETRNQRQHEEARMRFWRVNFLVDASRLEFDERSHCPGLLHGKSVSVTPMFKFVGIWRGRVSHVPDTTRLSR